MNPCETPSQTIGPFFRPSLIRPELANLANPETRGQRITIAGRIIDGLPVSDAMVEIWQANSECRYDHPEDTQKKPIDPHFHGFGRTATDSDGSYRFRTIRPGSLPGPRLTLQAPHINVSIFARGLLNRLVTRIYFPGEPLNDTDPLLSAIEPVRRSTLIAHAAANAPERELRFDIVLQVKTKPYSSRCNPCRMR
jgi:protocatechuate 3,4-dioxygenase, alpha subunit